MRSGRCRSPPWGDDKPLQLLHRASGLLLEQALRKQGLPPTAAHDEGALSPECWPLTSAWLDETGPALALTITSAAAMLDLDAVVIDGSMHRKVMDEVLLRTEQVLDRYSWEGINRPRLLVGSVGSDARALGGAILPLYRHFAPLHDLFLKAAPEDARSEP